MSPSVAPAATSHPTVIAATELAREARILGSTAAILGWDQETMMPNGGLAHRARQFAQLARLEHGMATDKRLGELLEEAAEATASLPETHPDRVNIREFRRDWERATKLPAALVEELASVSSIAQHETEADRKSTRLNSSHLSVSRMPSSA